MCFCLFFFFKQKTAYEMRISDWSSDVCSSDLWKAERRLEIARERADALAEGVRKGGDLVVLAAAGQMPTATLPAITRSGRDLPADYQIGRASCRERVCQYV